jgi:hypothetical protein
MCRIADAMKPRPDAEWWIETTTQPVGQAATDAMLIVRLGLAVNALRAQQRFSDKVNDATGPAGARDRMWAFIQAVAFVREGLNILSGTGGVAPESPRVREFAIMGGATDALIAQMKDLEGGRHPMSPILKRVRNQLAFHWDPAVLWPWLAETAGAGDEIVWCEGVGTTNGEMVHRAAEDALVNAILPPEPDNPVALEIRFGEALPHLADAMRLMSEYFERAVAGFLTAHGAVTGRRSNSTTPA